MGMTGFSSVSSGGALYSAGTLIATYGFCVKTARWLSSTGYEAIFDFWYGLSSSYFQQHIYALLNYGVWTVLLVSVVIQSVL